jgi:hypothetical protein
MKKNSSVPEIIDPVFTKTSPKCSFTMTENEHFGLVFTKTGSITSGTGVFCIGAIFNLLLFTFFLGHLHSELYKKKNRGILSQGYI